MMKSVVILPAIALLLLIQIASCDDIPDYLQKAYDLSNSIPLEERNLHQSVPLADEYLRDYSSLKAKPGSDEDGEIKDVGPGTKMNPVVTVLLPIILFSLCLFGFCTKCCCAIYSSIDKENYE